MLRSKGARLASWFALSSLGSKLDDDSSITFLRRGNSWEFGSGICNSSRFLGNSENGNQRDGVWFGLSRYGLDLKRLFHGTVTATEPAKESGAAEWTRKDGSTDMAAKDYYDILGTSKNARASEFLKANYEEHHFFKLQREIEKIQFEQRKDLENLHGELREHKAAIDDVRRCVRSVLVLILSLVLWFLHREYKFIRIVLEISFLGSLIQLYATLYL